MTDSKESILAEARATLERTSPENLDRTRFRYVERMGNATVIYSDPPPEDRVERWKREKTELVEARQLEKERIGIVERTAAAVARIEGELAGTRKDLADGLGGVNTCAEAIYGWVTELSADVNSLRDKFAASEAKVDELRKLLDDKRKRK